MKSSTYSTETDNRAELELFLEGRDCMVDGHQEWQEQARGMREVSQPPGWGHDARQAGLSQLHWPHALPLHRCRVSP